mmetsp:Transcript_2763/g.6434  ORF Transcript_2763/g.6434 Transcript_2763/m.6434 type:complete len:122 (-) Transcript_2763:35-400(-)
MGRTNEPNFCSPCDSVGARARSVATAVPMVAVVSDKAGKSGTDETKGDEAQKKPPGTRGGAKQHDVLSAFRGRTMHVRFVPDPPSFYQETNAAMQGAYGGRQEPSHHDHRTVQTECDRVNF